MLLIINSFLLQRQYYCLYTDVQMYQRTEGATAARSEKNIAELRASKTRKTSVPNSSQCWAAEQHSCSQPAQQEFHLQGSEQVIGMLQPLLPVEEDQQKPSGLWSGPSASGAIQTTN